MTDVKLPDGTTLKFPDSMTPDDIKGVLRQKFGAPKAQEDDGRGANTGMMQPEPRSFGDQLLRQGGLTIRNSVEGLAGLPAMVGNAVNSTANLGIKGVNELAGTNIPYFMKPSDAVSEGLTAMGLPQPETATERIVSYPSKALAGMGVTTLAGKAAQAAPGAISGLADLAKGLAPQAGGAIGGGLAQGATAEVTDNPVLQFLANLAGAAGGGALAGKLTQAPAAPIPSTKEVKAQAKIAFKAADDAEAIIKPAPLQKLTQDVIGDATDFGYLPTLHPRIGAVIQELERVNSTNITTKGMMTLRKVAQNAAKSNDPAEQALGSQIINRIDDMMETLGPDDIVQGNIDDAASSWAKGRELWNQFRKSEKIDKALEKADRQAQKAGSGGNTDNALRQRISAILDNDKARRGFTKDEIATMEAIVKGSKVTNAARLLGKFSPTAGFLPAAFSAAAYPLGGAPAMLLPLGGMVAKGYADRSTRGAIEGLSELIRAGGRYGPPPVNQGIPPSLLGMLPGISQSSGLLDPGPRPQERLLPAPTAR